MSAVGWASSEHPVVDALEGVDAALDGVAEVACWSLPDDKVDELLAEAHRQEARLAELTVRLVAEADRRDLAKRAGGPSTQAWLRRRLRVAPAEAKRRVRLAAGLCRLEATRRALAAGDISRAHAQVVVKVMDTLPTAVGTEALAAAERQVIGWCREFDPVEVARLGRRLWEVVDPDRADEREAALLERREREAKRRRSLSFGADGFGSHLLRGVFDPESAAVIAAALGSAGQAAAVHRRLPGSADGGSALRRRPGRGVPPPTRVR